MSSDVIHFWNMQLGGSVAHLDSDVLLEMMLLESALLKTTSELYIRDKLELIWFNQFVRKFNDQASETGNSKTFNSLVKALIDTNAGQLSLYREVDDNPSQSCTVRVNINPHKIATLMMEQKDEVFQDIVQLMSLIARENDECYKFAALNRDEGEEIAKRNRASVFSSIDVKWPGPLLKANFEVLNLFVTNFALDRCKKRKGEELATYLKDFVENISYSKTLSDLLTIRNRQKEDGRSSKAGTGRSSSSSSSSSGGGGGGDFDDSVASQATSPSSSTSSVLTTALPFSLRLTVGVGSSTAPAAYPTGRNARYMDRDSYAPGSPRHLLERLLVLRQQVDDEERDQLRMEGNRIITSDNSEFPSIHSRVGNNQRLFFTPNINIKNANAVPPPAPTPTNEKEEEEEEEEEEENDYDNVEAEYNEKVVATTTRPAGEYTVFAINDGKTQATEEDEDDNAYISDFDDWMEGQLEKQQARTASAGGGETETEAERRRRIYSNPSSSSSSSSSAGSDGNSNSSGSGSGSNESDDKQALEYRYTGAEVGVLIDSMDIEKRGQALDVFRQGGGGGGSRGVAQYTDMDQCAEEREDSSDGGGGSMHEVRASCPPAVRVLVCSDLAARGLDIPSTSLVIQMNLPSRVEDYMHRAGRTGRLNRGGMVVTLTHKEEQFVVDRYSNEIGVPISLRKLKMKTNE